MAIAYAERADGILEVTGADRPSPRIEIPGHVHERAVTAVASHAFAGREDIREIALPDTIEVIGSYAFYNCAGLRTLRLTDHVEDIRDGAIRMCPSLRTIEIAMRRGYYRLIKDLVGDSEAELYLRLCFADGEAGLLFPGYFSEYREDTRARAIHSTIVGAGYAYRQCVTRSDVDFDQYDACFPRLAAYDPVTAGRIAVVRLVLPYHLSEGAAERYRAHLVEHGADVLPILIRRGEKEETALLCGSTALSRDALDDGIRLASEQGETEICGILMDAMSRLYAGERQMETFSL